MNLLPVHSVHIRNILYRSIWLSKRKCFFGALISLESHRRCQTNLPKNCLLQYNSAEINSLNVINKLSPLSIINTIRLCGRIKLFPLVNYMIIKWVTINLPFRSFTHIVQEFSRLFHLWTHALEKVEFS